MEVLLWPGYVLTHPRTLTPFTVGCGFLARFTGALLMTITRFPRPPSGPFFERRGSLRSPDLEPLGVRERLSAAPVGRDLPRLDLPARKFFGSGRSVTQLTPHSK